MRTLGNGQVVGQGSDFAQAQAGFELDLELGDDRPGLDFHHADVEAEIEEGFFQDFRAPPDFFLMLVERVSFAGQE